MHSIRITRTADGSSAGSLTNVAFTPVAGPIFETKIERFFWRDFSGEELLPENSFLGPKIRSIFE